MKKKNLITVREADGGIINMEIHDSLESTAKLAREYAGRGYPDRYIVFAEKLIPESPQGSYRREPAPVRGVFFSCILRPSLFPSQASLLGALSATAFVQALDEHTTRHLGLGWVSDVYCQGVKIGDVTIEGKLDSFTTYEYIIVTFSAKLDEESFPPRLGDMVRKVFESENTSISMIIARNVIAKFFKLYSTMKSSVRFMDVYTKLFILRGRRIKYIEDGRRKSCKVLGIDTKTGALILESRERGVFNVISPTSVIIPKRIRLSKKETTQLA